MATKKYKFSPRQAALKAAIRHLPSSSFPLGLLYRLGNKSLRLHWHIIDKKIGTWRCHFRSSNEGLDLEVVQKITGRRRVRWKGPLMMACQCQTMRMKWVRIIDVCCLVCNQCAKISKEATDYLLSTNMFWWFSFMHDRHYFDGPSSDAPKSYWKKNPSHFFVLNRFPGSQAENKKVLCKCWTTDVEV